MKKILAFLLSAVMIAALAGCGSKPASNAENTSTAETAALTEAAATEAPATQETLAADVKAKLDQALEKEKFKGVAQITKGDTVIYQYVNGDDDNGKPLTADSSLPLASVSKQFCAAAVMKLCDENKLSVDDTLDKFYPDYEYGKTLTIKHLLTMGSGIPNYNVFLEPSMLGGDEEENIKIIREAMFAEKLDFEPGDDYEYSNSNYFLLADIVSQVSGAAYHDFLRKNFFEPLEMTHTGFVQDILEDQDWASALSKTELMLETTNPGVANGAGDIVSNAADMDKWMRGLSGGKIISSDAWKEMTGNPNPNSSNGYSYGLWQMSFDGMGHVGQIEPHFGAVDYINTDREVYLFGAANTMSGLSFAEEIPQTLLAILFENE